MAVVRWPIPPQLLSCEGGAYGYKVVNVGWLVWSVVPGHFFCIPLVRSLHCMTQYCVLLCVLLVTTRLWIFSAVNAGRRWLLCIVVKCMGYVLCDSKDVEFVTSVNCMKWHCSPSC